jgi:hypothetical protein
MRATGRQTAPCGSSGAPTSRSAAGAARRAAVDGARGGRELGVLATGADRVLSEEAVSEHAWHRVNADGDAGTEAAVKGGAAAAGAGGFLVHDDKVCAAAEELKELAAGLLAAVDHGPGCCSCDAEEDADTTLVEAVAGLTSVLVVEVASG